MPIDFGEKKKKPWGRGWAKKNNDSYYDDDNGNYYDNEKDKFTLGIRVLEF